MRCPNCGSLQTQVTDSRESKDGRQRNRKRKCISCGSVFYTRESVINMESSDKVLPIIIAGGAFLPDRAHPTDAGLDLRSPISIKIPAHETVTIDTGIAMAIPDGYVGLITSKSGMMLKGITSRGTIDSTYRGTIKAVLYNSSGYHYQINAGDKITQIVLLPIITPQIKVVEELSETERGIGGFGSSGK